MNNDIDIGRADAPPALRNACIGQGATGRFVQSRSVRRDERRVICREFAACFTGVFLVRGVRGTPQQVQRELFGDGLLVGGKREARHLVSRRVGTTGGSGFPIGARIR